MDEFVRVCPRCAEINPEYEPVCLQCGQFIGMVNPVVRPQENQTRQALSAQAEVTRASKPVEVESPARQTTATHRYVPRAFRLNLAGSDKYFNVGDGMVIGQSHESSRAQVQIPADVDGVQFVHRQHCRFVDRVGTWHVIPIDQAVFGHDFTNPTYVNERLVPPGEAHPLRSGDTLRLSGLALEVVA